VALEIIFMNTGKYLLGLLSVVLISISPFYSFGQDSVKDHLDAYMRGGAKTGFNGNVAGG
jgi:hypothetical protein